MLLWSILPAPLISGPLYPSSSPPHTPQVGLIPALQLDTFSGNWRHWPVKRKDRPLVWIRKEEMRVGMESGQGQDHTPAPGESPAHSSLQAAAPHSGQVVKEGD